MACGACGGAAAKAMQRRAVSESKPKPIPKSTQTPRLRPTATSKIVIKTTTSTIKVKEQLHGLKSCPLCGAALSPILSGSGARNRKRCTRCNRTFV
jgi:hypothetical protein